MEEKQELIQAYLTLADKKLGVAQELLDAFHYDDALSRGYYAMFYAAKAALLAIDQDSHSHSGTISQFSQHLVKTNRVERQYGRILSRMMQAREVSDYNPTRRSSLEEAKEAIANATSFVARIKELLHNI